MRVVGKPHQVSQIDGVKIHIRINGEAVGPSQQVVDFSEPTFERTIRIINLPCIVHHKAVFLDILQGVKPDNLGGYSRWCCEDLHILSIGGRQITTQALVGVTAGASVWIAVSIRPPAKTFL